MATSPIKPFSNIATDPVRNFRFLVEFKPQDQTYTQLGFNPNPSVGFVAVSGLSVDIDSIAYREGGYNTTMHQFPGQTSFRPITFSRGVILGTNQHHDWVKEIFAVLSGTSSLGIGNNFRCDIDITVLSHPNPGEWSGSDNNNGTDTTKGEKTVFNNLHASMKFRVYNAWINNLSYGDLSAGGNDLMVESLSVVHEGWDVIWAKGLKTSESASADGNNTFIK